VDDEGDVDVRDSRPPIEGHDLKLKWKTLGFDVERLMLWDELRKSG